MPHSSPALDPLATEYVQIAYGLDRHMDGLIDAYLGPEDVRESALAGPAQSPSDLQTRAESLRAHVEAADIDASRTDYLVAQITGLLTIAQVLAGDDIGYREEVRRCFDIEPERTPDSVYDDAIAALDDALPGNGPVRDRMQTWREQFEIPVDTARHLVPRILDEVRARAAEPFPLPAGEEIDVTFVNDKPWSGYNWYLGDGRSRVELNTDLPLRANTLLDLVCHEGYPGHHTEHVVKEQHLYRERGYGEHAIQLINTPECVLSEGIATLAQSMIFAPGEAEQWQADYLYADIGISVAPAQERQITEAHATLRSLAGNVALMLHEDQATEEEAAEYLVRYGLDTPERAQQRLAFLTDRLWRPYVFTYHVGRDLITRWLDQEAGSSLGNRQATFSRLIASQVTPSALLAATETA